MKLSHEDALGKSTTSCAYQFARHLIADRVIADRARRYSRLIIRRMRLDCATSFSAKQLFSEKQLGSNAPAIAALRLNRAKH